MRGIPERTGKKNGRARHEAVRENSMYGKGRGGQVLHCSSARHTLAHTHRMHRALCGIHTCMSVSHALCQHRLRCAGLTLRHEKATFSHQLHASVSRTRIAAAGVTLRGKSSRLFYAFRPHGSLRLSSKRRWHGTCSCRAAVFSPRASGRESGFPPSVFPASAGTVGQKRLLIQPNK